MSPDWRGPERLTDSPVCRRWWGRGGGWQREGWRRRVLSRGATRGALMRGGDSMLFLLFGPFCLQLSPVLPIVSGASLINFRLLPPPPSLLVVYLASSSLISFASL